MDLKQKYREETNLEPYGDINQKDNYTRHYVKWLEKQCNLYGVGISTYKIAISDRFCTYDFEIKLPNTTCIRDIARRLYASFGLKEEQGRLRE